MALMEESIDEMVNRTPVSRQEDYYKFIDPLPGHESPSLGAESPDISYWKIYEIFRGYGIWKSLSRISKMYVDKEDFSDLLDEYRDIRSTDPSDGKYQDLARAVSRINDVDFDYEKTDYGHLLRMWDDEGVEWQLPIRRGEHLERGTYDRDYSESLGVDDISDTEYMSYQDIREVEHLNIDDVLDEIE